MSLSLGQLQRLGLGVGAAVFIADQLTKWWALDVFADGTQPIEVLPFFNLVLVWNTGVSFGMFGGLGPWFFIIVSLVISAALAFWLMKAENRLSALSLGLIIGGALGNVIDRVRFGAVVDFLDAHAMGYHWPAFNVADSAIVVGAAFLILESLFSGAEKPKTDA